MKTLINPRTNVLTAMILSAGIWRLCISGGHSPLNNFTPIGAIAMFGGCYFKNRWKALLLPLLTLWISDLFLNYFVYYHAWRWFYDGFAYTYASFALMVVIGRFIKTVNIRSVLLAGLSSALLHWIITDFGVWLDGRIYPMDSAGLIACYVAALPYLQNMLIGNLVFGAIMFGTFESLQKRHPQLQLNPA